MAVDASNALLHWYAVDKRRLPWRAEAEERPDPYRVWLSEVMLQQTTVAAVRPYFEKFTARWPTVEALAAAPEADVMAAWAGLGYYARARNLIASARELARRGAFPTGAAELRKLPGIGDYTAAAIAAIAFGEQVAAVDTNIARVIARLHGLQHPSKTQVESLARAMIPTGRSADFTQAMMDHGATICRPKSPQCGRCPVRPHCAAFASGTPEAFPAPKQRRARPHKHGVAYWIERCGSVWLVRRPIKGLLGGMAALPGPGWVDAAPPGLNAIGTVRHVFTHFSLDLHLVPRAEPEGDGWWQPLGSLAEAGLPTLYRRAAELVAAARQAA